MSIQSMQEFIPVRTPVANDKLSEGMLSWSLVLPPVSNILQLAAMTNRDIMPVKMTRNIAPFMTKVGGSTLLPKDFQSTTVNATPPSSTTTPPTTIGQTGNPNTTSGTTQTAPLPVATTGDVPLSYAVYTFKPSVTRSVATVTQLRSISLSLTYYLPDWTFAIWIPSIQRYIEYVSSAPSTVPNSWVTINAATNIEASGNAAIDFIFGLRTAQLTNLTAPYGSILVNNYKVDEHLFVSSLGGTGGNGGSMVYPASGVAVSTGTSWDTSLDAANLARTDTGNIFAASQTFNSGVSMAELTIGGLQVDPYPPSGIAVSSGTSWSTSIVPANVPLKDGNNTFTGNVVSTNGYKTGPNVGSTQTASFDWDATEQTARVVGINTIATNAGGVSLEGYSSDYTRAVEYIRCYDDTTNGYTVHVDGTFTAMQKNFRITHPLDDSKYLTHSCLEGTDAGVYYRGEDETKDGMVTVTLPEYFEALTREENRSVHLTELYEDEDNPVFGNFLSVGRIKDGKFNVRSSNANVKFYWEVKAVRSDVKPLVVVTDKER